MSRIGNDLYRAIQKDMSKSGAGMPNAGVLAAALRAELISQITASAMLEGVKSALISSVSVSILSENRAVVSVSAMRPSIYEPFGLYGSVDLALVYDHRKRIKPTAIFYDPRNPSRGVIPVGRYESFAKAYDTNYLQKTADAFMAAHPECIVTVSK